MSDLSEQVQEHEDRITNLEDNQEQSADDLQQSQDDLANTIDEIQQQQADDENNIGQLTFPLSQDTIDLITEQAPAILQAYINQGYGGKIQLVGGSATLLNNNITTDSIIIYSTLISLGIPVIAVGDNHLYYSVAITAGQAVFTSSIATDVSTLAYLIL